MEVFQFARHVTQIIVLVFILLVVVEYVELRTRGKAREWLKGGRARQYVASSLMGVSPGCVGAFGAVSLYTHGFLSLGSIAAAMVATSGDGAFLMLAMFPKVAVALFFLLFIIAMGSGFLTDKISGLLHIETCKECTIPTHYADPAEQELEELTLRHFFRDHVVDHIVKKHLPKLALWVVGGLLVIGFLNSQLGLEAVLEGLPISVLLFSAVFVGLIPGSEPHIPFVLLFAEGAIPFSVLLANSVVQDGHGLLPMLSYTVRDSLIVKVFNAAYGLVIGLGVAVFLGW